MKYMGSKSKVAKYIVPIIQQKITDHHINIYIEPFCGGCNIIDKIVCEKRIASDNQKYLIAMLKNLDKIKDLPFFVTKEHYSDVRNCFNESNNDYPDWYVGAIGFLASYNGRFFDGGYAGLIKTKTGVIRNYYDEARRNLESQIELLNGVKFDCSDYKCYTDYSGCLFYLDPPYENKKQYGSSKEFDYKEFWSWCRYMSRKNIVLISEQNAPPDFQCIWQQSVKRTIDNTKRVNALEKLFEIK